MKEYLQQFLDHVEELAEEHDGIDGFTREFNVSKISIHNTEQTASVRPDCDNDHKEMFTSE